MMEDISMTVSDLQQWMIDYPIVSLFSVIILSIITFLIARGILGRGLIYIASHTKTTYDDIVVKNLRPFRVAWLAPLLLIYSFAYLLPDLQNYVEKASLFLILWVGAVTINALINAANEVYEKRPGFTGVSIQGYLDIVKILVIIVGIILSISLITDESPVVLLTGLGALTAVLLLIFQDTILSFVASIRISTHDLVKEGDWLEVPTYEADGEVINMTLHTIEIQNWDMTISVIPTHKMTEVAYKNWRGMQESGGRRIKRSIYIDLASIKFCDREMIERFGKVDIIQEYLDSKLREIESEIQLKGIEMDSPLDGRQLTNVGTFRAYIEAYLSHHPDIHTEKMTFLVRSLAPEPKGLPLEIYVFTKTTDWIEYETIQADIIDHLLAAASYFDLSLFQEPAGKDFARLVSTNSN